MRLSPSRQLTDGFDSGSTHTSNQTADALNRAEASLYAIRYKSSLGSSFAPDLYRLILDTAGIRFHPPDGDTNRSFPTSKPISAIATFSVFAANG